MAEADEDLPGVISAASVPVTKKKYCTILLVITMIVNEFIITIGFGGRGARSIRGCAQITQRCAD